MSKRNGSIRKLKRIQNRRKKLDREIDARFTAKNLHSAKNEKAVNRWKKSPNRSDIRGIDTKGKGKGWRERKHPLTKKAPRHQEVALEAHIKEMEAMGKTKIAPSVIKKEIKKIDKELELSKWREQNEKKIQDKLKEAKQEVKEVAKEVSVTSESEESEKLRDLIRKTRFFLAFDKSYGESFAGFKPFLKSAVERAKAEAKKRGFKLKDLKPGEPLPEWYKEILEDKEVKETIDRLKVVLEKDDIEAIAAFRLIEEILELTGDEKLKKDKKTQAGTVYKPDTLEKIGFWKNDYIYTDDDRVDLEGVDTKKIEEDVKEEREKDLRRKLEVTTWAREHLSKEDIAVLTTASERAEAEITKRGLKFDDVVHPGNVKGIGFSDKLYAPDWYAAIERDRKVQAVLRKLEKIRPANSNDSWDAIGIIKDILKGTGDAKLVDDRKTKATEVVEPFNLKDVKRWKDNYLHDKEDKIDLEGVDTKK